MVLQKEADTTYSHLLLDMLAEVHVKLVVNTLIKV